MSVQTQGVGNPQQAAPGSQQKQQRPVPTVNRMLASNLTYFRENLRSLDRGQLQELWRNLQDRKAPLLDFFKQHYKESSSRAATVLASLPMPAGFVNGLRLNRIQEKLQIMVEEVPKMDDGLRAEIAAEKKAQAEQAFFNEQMSNLRIRLDAQKEVGVRGRCTPSRL